MLPKPCIVRKGLRDLPVAQVQPGGEAVWYHPGELPAMPPPVDMRHPPDGHALVKQCEDALHVDAVGLSSVSAIVS